MELRWVGLSWGKGCDRVVFVLNMQNGKFFPIRILKQHVSHYQHGLGNPLQQGHTCSLEIAKAIGPCCFSLESSEIPLSTVGSHQKFQNILCPHAHFWRECSWSSFQEHRVMFHFLKKLFAYQGYFNILQRHFNVFAMFCKQRLCRGTCQGQALLCHWALITHVGTFSEDFPPLFLFGPPSCIITMLILFRALMIRLIPFL